MFVGWTAKQLLSNWHWSFYLFTKLKFHATKNMRNAPHRVNTEVSNLNSTYPSLFPMCKLLRSSVRFWCGSLIKIIAIYLEYKMEWSTENIRPLKAASYAFKWVKNTHGANKQHLKRYTRKYEEANTPLSQNVVPKWCKKIFSTSLFNSIAFLKIIFTI